jgi:hypothetical protein
VLIIHGVHHFWPKRVGFRNDYCLGCDKPRRSVAIRTLDVVHLFWIPILPLGFWKHWQCSECGRDPHRHVRTRRAFKWIGFGLLAIVAAMLWLTPAGTDDSFQWFLRVAATAAALALWIHLLRTASEPSLKQRLAAIPEAQDVICPFCNAPLHAIGGGRWSCPSCGIARY